MIELMFTAKGYKGERTFCLSLTQIKDLFSPLSYIRCVSSAVLSRILSCIVRIMSLSGKVCVVTGASRGIGKGIALTLGGHGATVYITGRTMKSGKDATLPGSLEITAREIEDRGGKCIAVQCDHSKDDDVKKLFEQVSREQDGQLDILVNNAFSAFHLCTTNIKVPFWELPDDAYDQLNQVGLRNHYLCSVLAAKLMVPRKTGLIINISGHGGMTYTLNVPYGIGKEGCDRMAVDCARDLKPHNVACVCLWPCVVKTEGAMQVLNDPKLSAMMALEAGIDEKIIRANYEFGESTEYVGKCVVNLALDKDLMKKSGKIFITSDLGDIYGFRDDDGHKPINIRRVNCLMRFAPSWISWLGWFIPDFVKIPTWLLSFAGHKL